MTQAADLSASGRRQAVGLDIHRQLDADIVIPPCYNSGMALLIDGYNLLHVTDIFGADGPGTDLHRTRIALLNFLAASIDKRQCGETTIVFDAAGAPPGLPRTISHQGITVRFAPRDSDADELIEELLEEHPAPRSLTVVSSDHRVQRAARHRGASYIDSGEWYAELRAARRAMTDPEKTPAKPTELSPGELTYWLGEFETPISDDDVENPFPPGYGDDIADAD